MHAGVSSESLESSPVYAPLATQLAELFVVKAVVLLTLSSHTLDIIQSQNYSNYGFNGSWVGWEVHKVRL